MVETEETEVINGLITSYRLGNSYAAEGLIRKFAPLINSHWGALMTGRFGSGNTELSQFKGLFSSKKIAKQVEGPDISSYFKRFESIELKHICEVSLLETCINHQNISKNYKYILYENLRILLLDKGALRLDCVGGALLYGDGGPTPYKLRDVEIDNDWVEGQTAGFSVSVFSDLDAEERKLIKMIWHDEIPAVHICRALGYSKGELEKKKGAIVTKLSQKLFHA